MDTAGLELEPIPTLIPQSDHTNQGMIRCVDKLPSTTKSIFNVSAVRECSSIISSLDWVSEVS